MNNEVKLFCILLVVGGLGGFIFGFNTGVIAGALPIMEEEFPHMGRSTLIQGTVTTAILLGSLVGAAFGATVGNILKKKRTIFLIGLITLIGSLGTALSPGLALIVVFREIAGLAVGLSSVIVPVYVAELAPKRFSGSLGSWFQVSLTFGILVSYTINLAFANVKFDFRWMFGCGAIPGLLLCLCYPIIPSAPSDLDTFMEDSMEKYSNKDKPSGIKMYIQLFQSCKKQVVIGFFLALTLQLTGINAVLYYAPTIFSNAGLSGTTSSLLASLGVGGWNFISTFIAIALVDRLGRRPLLLTGLVLMILSLFALGTVFQFVSPGTVSGIISIVLLLVYILGFEMGIGSLFWPLLTENFPPEYKDAGASTLNVVQWTLNILLAMTFPSLIQLLSQGIVFYGFGVVGLVCGIFLFIYLPETRAQISGSVQEVALSKDEYSYHKVPIFPDDERVFTDVE